jgi:hypothetical protein
LRTPCGWRQLRRRPPRLCPRWTFAT